MKVALLCSGLGHVQRGHEIFARTLFGLLADELDVTLFKGGGVESKREVVVPAVLRNIPQLDSIRLPVSEKWLSAGQEHERLRVEGLTFGYAALRPLLEGDYDIIHCLEQEVCETVYRHRHLFRKTPRIVFSNGGAIAGRKLPPCDAVQEYTAENLRHSVREKAVLIPHAVDVDRFKPDVPSNFRAEHGIPDQAFTLISVGAIAATHKRMDHVIRETAALPGAHLIIVGQEGAESAAIKRLANDLLGQRASIMTLLNDDLPQAYAAADAFVLGSLFEAFGIVYIEAMAMGLPVFCTDHVNQRSIVRDGVFVDMGKAGALTSALRSADAGRLKALGRHGRELVLAEYDQRLVRRRYVDFYVNALRRPTALPRYNIRKKILHNLQGFARRAERLLQGQPN